MSFRASCQIAAAITVGLSCVLLTAPQLVFGLFGIEGGVSAEVLARRAGVLLLGMSVTLWWARGATPSPSRRAVSLGTAVAMLGLAGLGAVEAARGTVGPGIWVAILTEVGLGAAFLRDVLAHRGPPA